MGIGFISENSSSGSTAQTLRERLIAASTSKVDDVSMQDIIHNGIDPYVSSVGGDQSQITLRTITLTTTAGVTTGQLQANFVPANANLTDSTEFSAQGQWTYSLGKGPLTDDRFAWVYDDYVVAKDVALLMKALVGRLPSLKEMGIFADGTYTSQQLGSMAQAYWLQTGGVNTGSQSLVNQVQAVINQAWSSSGSSNSATPDLINLGVNHLNGGLIGFNSSALLAA